MFTNIGIQFCKHYLYVNMHKMGRVKILLSRKEQRDRNEMCTEVNEILCVLIKIFLLGPKYIL